MADVMTIDSLDGLHKRARKGLAGAASDFEVLNAQVSILEQFEVMADAGLVAQTTVDSVRTRVERLQAQFDALLAAGGHRPAAVDPNEWLPTQQDGGITNEVLERAAAAQPAQWSAYMSAAHDLYTDVRAIVNRESMLSKVRSAAAFGVGAIIGALIVKRLT